MIDVSPLAGKLAPPSMLVNVPRLVTAYYAEHPDPSVVAERVAFGTSGHRGSAFDRSFNEAHILAIARAICSYRQAHRIDGPLFMGMDTHALSEPAFASALEVLAANGVGVMIDRARGYTPTPVISHAILRYNRGRLSGLADGIVVTPSHNPLEDGGFKYNPPTGGPADTDVTGWIEQTANALLAEDLRAVHRVPYERARRAASTDGLPCARPARRRSTSCTRRVSATARISSGFRRRRRPSSRRSSRRPPYEPGIQPVAVPPAVRSSSRVSGRSKGSTAARTASASLKGRGVTAGATSAASSWAAAPTRGTSRPGMRVNRYHLTTAQADEE